MSEKEKLEKMFALGFLATREGFNGECWYEHLAPHSDQYEKAIEEDLELLEELPEFNRLREQALKKL